MRNLLARAIAHPDKLTETTNFIALVLAWNGPIYPLYIWLVAGAGGMPAALATGSSIFFFGAVLPLSRRSSLASRTLLCLVGSLNSMFCAWVLGPGAGVGLFLLPCIILAPLAFRPSEWRFSMPLAALPILCGWRLLPVLPPPPHVYTPAQYQSLLSLNAGSVAVLLAFLGFTFVKAITPEERK